MQPPSSQGPHWAKDKTEEAKLQSAIFDLIDRGLAKRGELIEALHFDAARFSSVAEYRSVIDDTYRDVTGTGARNLCRRREMSRSREINWTLPIRKLPPVLPAPRRTA